MADSVLLGEVCRPHPEHASYAGRLSIPYLTPNGVVAMRFRAMGESDAKYLGLPGAQPRLYNVAALHTRLPYVAIVEGEFDALALTKAGVPAVGIAGTNVWFKHTPRCFADFETVYIICDNDVKPDKIDPESGEVKPQPNAGQVAAKKIVATLPNGVIITPPPNLDLSEWILRDGPQKVADAIGVSLLQSVDDHVNIALTEKEAIPY